MVKSHLIIVGYMGSGKSVVGKKLSSKIKLPFVDLDDEIVRKYQMSISKIFETKGEIEFRKIERKVLLSTLNRKDKTIISLGGGTPCYFDNMDIIKKITKHIYYINTSLNLLNERLFNEKEFRPMISRFKYKNELKEFIAKHLFERKPFYDMSTYKIDCSDNKTVDDVCEEIINTFN